MLDFKWGQILEITFILVLAYLIFNNPKGFSTFISGSAAAYTSSVKALQGR